MQNRCQSAVATVLHDICWGNTVCLLSRPQLLSSCTCWLQQAEQQGGRHATHAKSCTWGLSARRLRGRGRHQRRASAEIWPLATWEIPGYLIIRVGQRLAFAYWWTFHLDVRGFRVNDLESVVAARVPHVLACLRPVGVDGGELLAAGAVVHAPSQQHAFGVLLFGSVGVARVYRPEARDGTPGHVGPKAKLVVLAGIVERVAPVHLQVPRHYRPRHAQRRARP